MRKRCWLVPLLLLFLLGCRQSSNTPPPLVSETPPSVPTAAVTPSPVATDAPTPTPEPTPDVQFLLDEGVLVSEVFIGTSRAFVELYNAGDAPYDLADHNLVYQQADDRAEIVLAAWTESALIPPHGHYLLVQENASVGVLADRTFEALLSAESGSLILFENSEIIEQATLAWGDTAPSNFQRGEPAPASDSERSIERLPGGDAGNGRESGDNASDVLLRAEPNPQNSGSPATPAFAEAILISVELPETVVSGAEFGYFVRIRNQTGETLEDVRVSIPFDDAFEPTVMPNGAEQIDNRLEWTIETLVADANITEPLYINAPFKTDTLLLNGGFVSAENYPISFANVTSIEIEGGVIPIAAARGQLNQVVTVAGVATASTGTHFVPDDGQQFYIEDSTGGIKVYVPAVSGRAVIAIGDQVRVVGTVRNFRGAVELVPSTAAVNVSRLGRASGPQSAADATLDELVAADELFGQLLTVSGVATRVEAFPHWYELVLADDADNEQLVRIDRVSAISAAELTVGERYQVFGVFDSAENERFLKPRTQSDIVPLPAPELTVDYRTPSSIAEGETATHSIVIANNSDETIQNLIIAAGIPLLPNAVYAGDPAQPSGNGQVAGDGKIYWGISELPPGGSTETLTFELAYKKSGEAFAQLTLSAETLNEPIDIRNRIFIGQNVPIHIVQGSGDRSPYVGQTVTTNGTVTAIFPGLNAIAIQTVFPDDDPSTSEGLFVRVNMDDLPRGLRYGDALQLRGRVVEQRGQTTLLVDSADDIDQLPRIRDLSALEPVVLDPPIDSAEAAAYYEPLEGMRVGIREPALVVAPTNSDGETVLVLRKRRVDQVPLSTTPPGYTIVLDDGRAELSTDSGDEGEPLIFQKGDSLRRVTGVLAFTNDQFKIEPFSPEAEDRGILRVDDPPPSFADGTENGVTLATFNTGGLFDRLQPHPVGLELPTRESQMAQFDALAEAIVRMGAPAVVALQEVETLQVLEELVGLDALGAYQYTPLLLKGDDPLGYNNAFLLREKLLPLDSLTQQPGPDGLTRRPPLVLETRIDGVQTLLVNVHLVSAESGESTTESSRLAQAAWVSTLVDDLRAQNRGAEVIVLGDLGSAWDSAVVNVLNSAELTHAFATLPDDQFYPYTAIERGYTVAPDAILLSDMLLAQLERVEALHIHADLPIIALDEAATPRIFDRDPLLITLTPTTP